MNNMNDEKLIRLLEKLIAQPKENEWIEFKLNYHSVEEIGESLSALANGACLFNQTYGYLVFGVKDTIQTVEGTTFKPRKMKKGNEEIEHWLAQRLEPRIDFRIYEFLYQDNPIVLFEIPAAENQPVRFKHKAYIRIGSITRELKDFPEKERKIWNKKPEKAFEEEPALKKLSADDIVNLLDTQSYFDLIKVPYPTTREAVLDRFIKERFIKKIGDSYLISNLGGILFAKDIGAFPSLSRKSVRVILYNGIDRINTRREQIGTKGYAIGFEGLVSYINSQLPENEEIGKVFRQNVRMYPEIAIRELVANAIIHQDFREKGTGPLIEIFADRIEFTNPGLPLITPERFIDEYQSRNEIFAAFMRRIGLCEEKGSGIDKVVFQAEFYQLPAPDFRAKQKHTQTTMYAFKVLNKMDKTDKIRACYQHACLRYVSNKKMTNKSLRERFKIDEQNAAIASRIIRDTLETGLIKEDDPANKSKKFVKYVPFWA